MTKLTADKLTAEAEQVEAKAAWELSQVSSPALAITYCE